MSVSSRWGVVQDAISEFSDNTAYATASVISFTAGILPWLPIILLCVWALRFLWRFFRRRVVDS